MATLTLTKVWINRQDTGEAISAQSLPTRSRSHSDDGEVRTYAGGRQRAILRAGERGQFDFTLVRVSATTVDTLRLWKGLPVQVRDHRGQRFWGIFLEVPVIELRDEVAFYNVPLSLRIITVTEGV